MKTNTQTRQSSPPVQRKAGQDGIALQRKQAESTAPVQREGLDELKKLEE